MVNQGKLCTVDIYIWLSMTVIAAKPLKEQYFRYCQIQTQKQH